MLLNLLDVSLRVRQSIKLLVCCGRHVPALHRCALHHHVAALTRSTAATSTPPSLVAQYTTKRLSILIRRNLLLLLLLLRLWLLLLLTSQTKGGCWAHALHGREASKAL